MSAVLQEAEHRTTEAPTRRHLMARVRNDTAQIGIVVAAFLVGVLAVIGSRTPLGHDESVYVLRGRDIAELGWNELSGEYWVDYRAPGVPLLLSWLARVVGVHVTTSRALIAVLAVVVLLGTWAIGRRFAGAMVGVVAAVVLAVTSGFISTASTVLADVPGAAFSIVAVWIFGAEACQGRLRWAWLLVPILTLLACISRFGSPFMLGAGLVGLSVAVLPEVVRSRNWLLVAQAVLLGLVVALISWLVLFTELVSIRGRTPVDANRSLIEGKQLTAATGFRDLGAVVNPWSDSGVVRLWSAPVAVIVVVGVVAAITAALLGRVSRAVVAGISIAAIVSTVGIVASVGLIVNNYLALTLPYWALLVGIGWTWMWRVVATVFEGDVPRRALAAAACVIAIALLMDGVVDARRIAATSTSTFVPIRAASVELGEAYDGRCIAITSYTPQVGYFSGCIVTPFGSELDRPLDELLADRLAPYQGLVEDGYQPVVFLVDSGKRQPSHSAFDSPAVSSRRLFEHSVGDGRRQTSWVQVVDGCVLARAC